MAALKWKNIQKLPIIRQTESAECGLACLTMIACWHGLQTDLPTLRERFNVSIQGMTLQRLIDCASVLRLSSRAVKLEPTDLKSLKLPCILHWNMNHFVVLESVRSTKFIIHDPDKGRLILSTKEVGRHFTGIALEIFPAQGFTQKDERRKIKLNQLTGKIPGLIPAMTRILIFAMALEILTLGSPLLNQLVIDEVLVAADENLLIVIIIGLLLLSFTQMLLSLARQWASITLSVNFNMQWTARVFHHLLRLPLSWFDARSKGSINARFSAVDTIQEALTSLVLEGLIDVLLVITSFCMMLLYSPTLTLIAFIAALAYALIRALWYPSLRQAAESAWDAGARESGHFLETLNGILSLRINGVIAHREAAWLNLNVARRNTQLLQSRLLMYYDVAHTITASVVSVLILWMGAREVLNGAFTVGMLVAYLSYQSGFTSSMSSLTDKFFSWRTLDIYNERLADIILHPAEGEVKKKFDDGDLITSERSISMSHMTGQYNQPLVIDGVSYTHKGSISPVINDISLTLRYGEVVAITGKSGCGKSTLIKLILGIYMPDHGIIQTLGMPHTNPDYYSVRQHIGTVLQDDQLFRGSIADNIIFFNEVRDYEWMIQCSKYALINDDVMAMAMGYQTLIGETGGGLSGGQKQRILLARALYKRPQFLLLDEATSHLDVESEIIIGRILREVGMPVLLIAHRPETLASADRILFFENGRISHEQTRGGVDHIN
ncbi:peptidase domain-containing ABC transporter [Cronobacter dublinensis]